MKPVFKSCDVAPAFAAAMQMTAPTQSATGEYISPVQPSATKIVHVRIKVAMVMPEIGLDDEPISPVMRDATVTKKKPKMTIRIDARKLPFVGILGATARKMASASDPPRTTIMGMSRSVRLCCTADLPPPKSFTLSRNDATMVGIVRARVIRPEARTAPAPV